jgi:hypothetical protein
VRMLKKHGVPFSLKKNQTSEEPEKCLIQAAA